MATYNRPGVYVNELPLAAAPINGALAATAAGAVIAALPQGPDTVTRVTSWYDFVKKFGGYNKSYPATFSIGSFFKNGGTELYVKRVLPEMAKKVAKVTIPAGSTGHTITATKYSITSGNVTLTAVGHGILSSTQSITLSGFANAGLGLNGTYTIASKTTDTVTFAKPASLPANTVSTSVVTAASATGGTVTYVANNTFKQGQKVTITGTTSFDLEDVTIATASGTGFTVVNAATGTAETGITGSATSALDVPVDSTSKLNWTGVSDLDVLTIAAKHRGIDGNNVRVQFTQSKAIREAGYYDLTVYYEAGAADTIVNGIVTANSADDIIVEQFNGIVLNDPLSGDYISSVLEFGSAYIRVLEGSVPEYDAEGALLEDGDPGYVASYVVDGVNAPATDVIYPLSGAPSTPSALTYGDYTGNYFAESGYNPVTGEGSFDVNDCLVFTEFETVDKPLVFFLPDVTAKISVAADSTELAGWTTSLYVYNSLIDWVEAPKTNGRHFVVVETAGSLSVDGALSRSGDLTETSRAAVYYPHIYIKDPVGRSGASVRKIGPSGAVAGLFLDTDRKIGPFKSPAGIEVKITDAIALERSFSSSDLDALNSGVTETGVLNGKNVVNAIRNVPGAGVVIMGGRTLKQDGTANRFINMRRSLTYLEKRLNDLASFAVFENNTETLWARLITVIGVFLNEYRNQGGLRGTTIEQSYFIKCDNENNTAASIQAGEVHIEVGVALEYPAEFVVINLSQKTAE